MSDETFQRLLQEAMAKARCPACTVIDAIVFDELCQLQRQAVVNPETHTDVLTRGGYCADHFWYLDALTSPVSNAALLAPLMDRLADRLTAVAADLAASPALLRQGHEVIAGRLGVPAPCRVCERIGVWQDEVIAALLQFIANPGQRHRYADSGGVCLPHLARALGTCRDHELAEWLLHTAADHSRRLANDLREYVRKWHAKDRGWGPEDTAPRASIEKLVGAKRQRNTD
jgi:Family of unknown function (DUF6062)